MLRISPSKIPIYYHCGQAARAELPIQSASEAAAMGSAAHAAIAQYVRNGEHDPIWRWAERFGGLDEDELGWLVAYGRTCWDEIKGRFPDPVVERRLQAELADNILIDGTADVFSVTGRGCIVLDWKSTREKKDSWPQLAGYALLATEALGCEECAVSIAWLRHQEVETRILSRADLAEFKYQLIRSLNSQSFTDGAHCEYCPRRYECPALARKLQSSMGQLMTPEETLDAVIGAGRLPDLYDTVKAAEKACKEIRDGIKRRIEASGEFTSGGKLFRLSSYNRRNVDLGKAWPVLSEMFGDDISRAMSFSAREAEALAGQRMDGPKYKAKAAMWDALEQAGAVEKVETKKMEVKDADNQ